MTAKGWEPGKSPSFDRLIRDLIDELDRQCPSNGGTKQVVHLTRAQADLLLTMLESNQGVTL